MKILKCLAHTFFAMATTQEINKAGARSSAGRAAAVGRGFKSHRAHGSGQSSSGTAS